MKPLVIDGLTKEFRLGIRGNRILAVDRLNLEVDQGGAFGFLGPNGAGKTTTLKLLVGLLRPTSGKAWIMGRPIEDVDVKQEIGFLPEAPYFYEYLTGEEFLRFYGQLSGMVGVLLEKRIDQMLEMVQLNDARQLALRKYSKGMLQRVGLAQALIHDPKLIILDEPMSGLDPIGRRQVRDIILHLREEGKTIFFSTHILSDVEMICDRVGILVKGRLKAVGTVHELLGAGAVTAIEIVVEELGEAGIRETERLGGKVMRSGRQVLITLADHECMDRLLEIVLRHKAHLVSLVPHKRSLEDLFLQEVKEPRL